MVRISHRPWAVMLTGSRERTSTQKLGWLGQIMSQGEPEEVMATLAPVRLVGIAMTAVVPARTWEMPVMNYFRQLYPF